MVLMERCTKQNTDLISEIYRKTSRRRLRICGGLRFNERREVKDVISYLSVVNNPADNVRLRRILNVPKRAIGDTTVDTLIHHARQNDMSLYTAVVVPPTDLGSRAKRAWGILRS